MDRTRNPLPLPLPPPDTSKMFLLGSFQFSRLVGNRINLEYISRDATSMYLMTYIG